jgi:hypothetical protein
VEGQPLSRRKAEVTVRVRALVAIVDVRVEMNVVLALRAKLLTAVCEKEGRETEKERYDQLIALDGGRDFTPYKATHRCDDPYLVLGRRTGGLACVSSGGF